MQNELTDFEKEQLTQGSSCQIHTHEIELNDHKHLETLQSLEVVRNINSNYVVAYREDIIVVDTSSGDVSVTLPKSRGGKKFCIVKADASNVLTVNFSGGETMLGLATVTLTALADKRWFKGVSEGYIPL